MQTNPSVGREPASGAFRKIERESREPHKYAMALSIFILAAATLVIYYPILAPDNYFLSDDFGIIQVTHDKPLKHFFKLFFTDFTEDKFGEPLDEIRPIFAYLMKWDWDHWGLNPFGYHLTSIFLQFLNVFMVFWIARTLARKNNWIALMAALFFVASPVHAESIGWITGRVNFIGSFFCFATFLFYLLFRTRQSKSTRYYVLSVVMMGVGLFSEPALITLPLLFLAYDLVYENTLSERGFFRRALKQVPTYIPFIGLVVFYLGLRAVVFGEAVRESRLSPDRFVQFLDRQPYYLTTLLSPVNLVAYQHDSVPFALASVTLGILLIAAAFLWRNHAQYAEVTKHVFFFGPFWYVLMVGPAIVADYVSARHLHQAAAGTAIAMAFLIAPASVKRAARFTAAQILAFVLLLGFYGATLVRADADWVKAGQRGRKMSVGIEEQLKKIPEGSRVVLALPALTDAGTWGWNWVMPFALQKPFKAEDYYEKYQILEAFDIYCCPVAHWWEARKPFIEALVADTEGSTPIYVLYWDEETDAVAVRTKHIKGEELKSAIEATFHRSFEELWEEIGWDEAQPLVELIAAPTEETPGEEPQPETDPGTETPEEIGKVEP